MEKENSSGSWLAQRIESRNLRKKDVCSCANIKYKTLRSYIAGATTPTLTAQQWFGLARVLDIDLIDLMDKFMSSDSTPR